MAFLKYFNRLKHLDDLINRKATGSPDELAKKMNLSRSVLMEYLRDMKELGFPIKFSKHRNCYYYENDEKCNDKLLGKILSKDELKKIKGSGEPGLSAQLEICKFVLC
jgi:predicted DNA-binding transcriptional regulator YafY